MTPTDRYDNVEDKVHCPYCCNQAIIPVEIQKRDTLKNEYRNGKRRTVPSGEHTVTVYGPCPACAMGYRSEFPEGERWGPWGKDGFWQGKPWKDFGVEKKCACSEMPASRDEAKQWIDHLKGMIKRIGKSVEEKIREKPATIVEETAIEEKKIDVPKKQQEPEEIRASHICPHYDPSITFPFAAEECEKCNPELAEKEIPL